jgi:hypothetical protein
MLTSHGTLNINGGTVDLKTVNNSGGAFNFTAGSLSYLGNLTVGTGGLLGTNLILNADRQLTLSGRRIDQHANRHGQLQHYQHQRQQRLAGQRRELQWLQSPRHSQCWLQHCHTQQRGVCQVGCAHRAR